MQILNLHFAGKGANIVYIKRETGWKRTVSRTN